MYGALGSDALRAFESYTLDFNAMTLELGEPVPAAAPPPARGSKMLRLRKQRPRRSASRGEKSLDVSYVRSPRLVAKLGHHKPCSIPMLQAVSISGSALLP